MSCTAEAIGLNLKSDQKRFGNRTLRKAPKRLQEECHNSSPAERVRAPQRNNS